MGPFLLIQEYDDSLEWSHVAFPLNADPTWILVECDDDKYG